MLNMLQRFGLHVAGGVTAQHGIEHMHAAFREVVAAHDVGANGAARAKAVFQLAASRLFVPPVLPPNSPDNLVSENIWDQRRGFALARWVRNVGREICKSDKAVITFPLYLDAFTKVVVASGVDAAAPISNSVLSHTYAHLLPITIALHTQDPERDVMTDYAVGLRDVWDAAGRYRGHQEQVRTCIGSILDKTALQPGGCRDVRAVVGLPARIHG